MPLLGENDGVLLETIWPKKEGLVHVKWFVQLLDPTKLLSCISRSDDMLLTIYNLSLSLWCYRKLNRIERNRNSRNELLVTCDLRSGL